MNKETPELDPEEVTATAEILYQKELDKIIRSVEISYAGKRFTLKQAEEAIKADITVSPAAAPLTTMTIRDALRFAIEKGDLAFDEKSETYYQRNSA